MKGGLFFGITLRVMLIMAVVEMAIMVFIEFGMPRHIRHLGVFIDPLLLVIIGAPLVAWWVVKPAEQARDIAIADANFIATHDPLTRLPNRRVFSQFVERVLHGARRRQHCGAVIYFDIDGLHKINETYGHDAGDVVLSGVADHVAAQVRGEDLLCRLGGDEFAVVLTDVGAERRAAEDASREIGEKIRQAVHQPIPFDRALLQVDASVGIRVFCGEAISVEDALRDAAVAMSQAKAGGRGRVVVVGVDAVSAYATNPLMHAEMARDHRQIESIVDEILDSPTHHLPALQYLAETISAHFSYENEVMRRLEYTGRDAHHEAHAKLSLRIQEMAASATESSAPSVALHIRRLIRGHIEAFDEAFDRNTQSLQAPPDAVASASATDAPSMHSTQSAAESGK